jgi:crotonobetainyl-CoA:carnitine CoA-transferase CaiB-like acyl-CoA transferase
VRFDGKPPQLESAPKLGQHTDEVFATWLNLSESDISELKAAKVIGN